MSTRRLRGGLPQRVGAALLGLYLELALRSTRWRLEGAEHLAPFLAGGPVVVACWHEGLAMIPALWLPSRHLHPDRHVAALASRHRDGQLIAAVLRRFGVTPVHGSSARTRPGEAPRERGGAAGLRALLAVLAEGAAVVLTPDGPRGPPRRAAPGIGLMAALSQAPVLAVGARTWPRVTLPSWDRMALPLPFGRGILVVLPPIQVARDAEAAGLVDIEAALSRAADRAAALCR